MGKKLNAQPIKFTIMEFYIIEHYLAIENEVVEEYFLTYLYVSNLHV